MARFSSWAAWAALLSCAVVLAGCAQSAAPTTQTTGDGLSATDTTGIMRGVVVDMAIRPLEGATISIQKPGGEAMESTSASDGSWGFDALDPGTYSVSVSRQYHVPALTVASVRAGEQDPPLVRVILEADLEAVPYVAVAKFDGFLQCGLRGGTGGVAACRIADSVAPVLDDRSTYQVDVENGPLWVQGEMVWRASQPLSDQLGFYFTQFDADGNGRFMGIYPLNMGKSPLLLAIDSDGVGHCFSCVETPFNMSAWARLQVTAMAGEMDATTPPTTVCSPTGQPCLTGYGVVLNQQFEVFLHFFYRTVPPEGWRFTNDGEPPL